MPVARCEPKARWSRDLGRAQRVGASRFISRCAQNAATGRGKRGDRGTSGKHGDL